MRWKSVDSSSDVRLAYAATRDLGALQPRDDDLERSREAVHTVDAQLDRWLAFGPRRESVFERVDAVRLKESSQRVSRARVAHGLRDGVPQRLAAGVPKRLDLSLRAKDEVLLAVERVEQCRVGHERSSQVHTSRSLNAPRYSLLHLADR